MIDRRAFLKYFGAAPIFLSGCACPCRRPPLIEWTEPTSLTPLAPSLIHSKDIPLAFDVHSHLFNATDVNVRGYLKGPVAHSMSPTMRKLIAAAAPLVEQFGKSFAISCGDEMKQLSQMITRMRSTTSLSTQSEIHDEIDRDIEIHRSRIEDELIRRLTEPRFADFANELDKADKIFLKSQIGKNNITGTHIPLSQNRERIRSGLISGFVPSARKETLSLEELTSSSLNPIGVLSFIRYMVSPRHHNLRAYQKAYSEENGAFGIDACFASLVDFDYWLGCSETQSSLHDQVLLHEQLAVLSGGYVLPLVPYNPWSDIESKTDKSFALVQWAIEKRGFVGVKIYPPMGFRPLGNDKPIDSKLKRPDGKELDKKLRTLYSWCQKFGVPVMAHTGHSMGRDDAGDDLASPECWEAVFSEFPKLHVNAGHFGGGFADWPDQFVKLMSKPTGSYLYADLAYEDDLLNPSSELTDRMKKLLRRKLADGSPVLSRVMYGSDWLMISQLNNWGSYAHGINNFLASISNDDINTTKRAVYFENAAHCFGLYQGQPNRKRLEDFYKNWEMSPPRWMEKLDNS